MLCWFFNCRHFGQPLVDAKCFIRLGTHVKSDVRADADVSAKSADTSRQSLATNGAIYETGRPSKLGGVVGMRGLCVADRGLQMRRTGSGWSAASISMEGKNSR